MTRPERIVEYDAGDFGRGSGRCGPGDCPGPGGGCPYCDETCVDRPYRHWHQRQEHPPFIPAPSLVGEE